MKQLYVFCFYNYFRIILQFVDFVSSVVFVLCYHPNRLHCLSASLLVFLSVSSPSVSCHSFQSSIHLLEMVFYVDGHETLVYVFLEMAFFVDGPEIVLWECNFHLLILIQAHCPLFVPVSVFCKMRKYIFWLYWYYLIINWLIGDCFTLHHNIIAIYRSEPITKYIQLIMEMGNVSTRQQPTIEQTSPRPPMGLQCSEKLLHPEASFSWPLNNMYTSSVIMDLILN